MGFIKHTIKMVLYAILMVALGGVVMWRHQAPVVIQQDEVTEALGVSYTVDELPIGNKRPGSTRKVKYIVVHNTANTESTAQNERDYLSNPNNTSSTSWHAVVDDEEIIQAIPFNEVAFHAGDHDGNRYGIGIEICESGDYDAAEANAAKLIAYLMKAYDLPIESVKTHQDFSGKACPRLILDHWEDFLEEVKVAYEALE